MKKLTQSSFLPLRHIRLTGTKLHLAGRGVCCLLQAKVSTWISPVGQILVLVHRFDREVVMTFQRFEFNFVFNEGLCLNK